MSPSANGRTHPIRTSPSGVETGTAGWSAFSAACRSATGSPARDNRPRSAAGPGRLARSVFRSTASQTWSGLLTPAGLPVSSPTLRPAFRQLPGGSAPEHNFLALNTRAGVMATATNLSPARAGAPFTTGQPRWLEGRASVPAVSTSLFRPRDEPVVPRRGSALDKHPYQLASSRDLPTVPPLSTVFDYSATGKPSTVYGTHGPRRNPVAQRPASWGPRHPLPPSVGFWEPAFDPARTGNQKSTNRQRPALWPRPNQRPGFLLSLSEQGISAPRGMATSGLFGSLSFLTNQWNTI